MGTKLRLHVDPSLLSGRSDEDESGQDVTSFRFPVDEAARRRLMAKRTLVSGKVTESPERDCAPDGGDPDVAGRVMSSPELVAEIERTLDRMHERLDRFKDELGGSFKFPRAEDEAGDDDDDRGPGFPSAA